MADLIVVTGATGVIGRELLPQLVDAGQRVRVLVRDPAKADFGPAVEIARGDLADPETLGAAFAGAAKAFVLVGGPDIATLEANAFEAARRAGVEHIVKLSALEAFRGHMDGSSLAEAHRHSEQRLRSLGVAWTMLRPGYFASNLQVIFLRKTPTGAAVYMPTGDGTVVPIDPADIASAAVTVLSSDEHAGKIYELTGPEFLTLAEMTQKMSEVTDVHIEHVDVTPDEARNRFEAEGFPPPFVTFLLQHAAAVKAGQSIRTDGVGDLLGRPPANFDDFLQRNSGSLKAILRETAR